MDQQQVDAVQAYQRKVKGIRAVLARDHMKVAFFGRSVEGDAHSRPPLLVPSLTSPGYDVPLTVTTPVRSLINIKRPPRLEPPTFVTSATTTVVVPAVC